MAAIDTTIITLQMLKEVQEQLKAADAAEERSRHDMMRMFQEIRTGSTCAATSNPTDRFPSLKIHFKEFSCEPEDWNNLSRVHQAQLFAPGCANALKANGKDDIKIVSGDFDAGDVHPEQL